MLRTQKAFMRPYPGNLFRLGNYTTAKKDLPHLEAGCSFCNRDAHHSKCKPMRARERALETVPLSPPSLPLSLRQHGSCTLTNSAARNLTVVDYLSPFNLEYHKTHSSDARSYAKVVCAPVRRLAEP